MQLAAAGEAGRTLGGSAGRRWPPLAGAPQPLRILESHSDIVVALPPGAVVLAHSRRTPVEVFTLGERVLCLQGHPEMDNEMVRELLESVCAARMNSGPTGCIGSASRSDIWACSAAACCSASPM